MPVWQSLENRPPFSAEMLMLTRSYSYPADAAETVMTVVESLADPIWYFEAGRPTANPGRVMLAHIQRAFAKPWQSSSWPMRETSSRYDANFLF